VKIAVVFEWGGYTRQDKTDEFSGGRKWWKMEDGR
jgi:hypothetical protein